MKPNNSIDNYKKVLEFQNNINTNTSFSDDEKDKITNIFILPQCGIKDVTRN
jgi:hypothetical protein